MGRKRTLSSWKVAVGSPYEILFPTHCNYVPIWFMTYTIEEPDRLPTTTIRHDGWTGEAMTRFLESLAATGIVMDACDAAGKSREAAYALRRRHPLFARAWELALGNARDRLADTLLARSLEGNVEQIVKDGEIVAEKHFVDNRLGLAILKRLDKRADEANGRRRPSSTLQPHAQPEWDLALTALRTGDEDRISSALVMLEGNEVDKVDTASTENFEDGSFHSRIWRSWQTEEWRTSYPPPPGFEGIEEGAWEDDDYCRALTEEELGALIAAGIAEPLEAEQISLEEDAAERDKFFAGLAAGVAGTSASGRRDA